VFYSRNADRALVLPPIVLACSSDDEANYVFPKTWPINREQRARIIGEWLQTEARFLV
jgi:hypothetical protein